MESVSGLGLPKAPFKLLKLRFDLCARRERGRQEEGDGGGWNGFVAFERSCLSLQTDQSRGRDINLLDFYPCVDLPVESILPQLDFRLLHRGRIFVELSGCKTKTPSGGIT